MKSYLDKYVPTKASGLTDAEWEQAQRSFDPNWGAPLSTQAVLGTYTEPDLWWKNFNKYYKEDETIDLSNVAGFKKGDIGIPIRNRKNANDPEWTVFNPSGLDFGDVAEHGDIVANILGYGATKAGIGATAFFTGGPMATVAGMAASEGIANTAGKGAEMAYDTYVRSHANPPHGNLENDVSDYVGDKAIELGIDTVVGTGTELAMNAGGAVGRGIKEAVKWPFKKLFGSPPHPTATRQVMDEEGNYVDQPLNYAGNIGETRKNLENPINRDMTPLQLEGQFKDTRLKASFTWAGHGDVLDDEQETLLSYVTQSFRTDRDSAKKWLDTFTDGNTSQDKARDMFKQLDAAQQNVFPIKIGLPSLGTVSHNRLIQLGEGFSNLFPLGHEVFEKSYNDMIKDIHIGMEDVARSWLHGKRYRPRTGDQIDEAFNNSLLEIRDLNNELWDLRPDELENAFKVYPYEDKLTELENMEIQASRGFIKNPRGNVLEFDRHAPGTPAYYEDVINQHQTDRQHWSMEPEEYDFRNIIDRTNPANDVNIKMIGKSGELVRPIDEFAPHMSVDKMTVNDIDRYLERVIENSPIASKDAIGGFARQGLEISHNQRMRLFDYGFEEMYDKVSRDGGIAPDTGPRMRPGLVDMRNGPLRKLMTPNLTETMRLHSEIGKHMERITPSGSDIYGDAYNRVDNIVKGLQPDYSIANEILQKLMTPADDDLVGQVAPEVWAEDRIELVELVDRLDSLRNVGTQRDDAWGWGGWSTGSVDPEQFNRDLSEAVLRYGDQSDAKLLDKFDKTIPTMKDVIREYDNLGQIIGLNTDDTMPIEQLKRVRRALRGDIVANMSQLGYYPEGSGVSNANNLGNSWSFMDQVKEKYLNETYYPMMRDIIESKSDKEAYDLLFENTREGPNKLKILMDNMNFDAQNAIKAGTFLRLGKENPQNYDYSDFDLRKFVKEWKRIPESNKEILFGTSGGLRGSMENFAKQIENLEHIEDRAGQGAVGQIVAATVIIGGMLGGVTGAAFTGDLGATASGAITGSIAIPSLTLASSWGMGKLFTNKNIIDWYIRTQDEAFKHGQNGKLKKYFDPVKGGFRQAINRFTVLATEEGLAHEAEQVIENMSNGLEATAAELDVRGWGDFDPQDFSNPQNMQNLLEGMSEAQGIELVHDMSPQDIKDLETIYREMGRSPQ